MDQRIITEKDARSLAALCAARIFKDWDEIEETACRQGQFEQDHRVQSLCWVSEIRDRVFDVLKDQGIIK